MKNTIYLVRIPHQLSVEIVELYGFCKPDNPSEAISEFFQTEEEQEAFEEEYELDDLNSSFMADGLIDLLNQSAASVDRRDHRSYELATKALELSYEFISDYYSSSDREKNGALTQFDSLSSEASKLFSKDLDRWIDEFEEDYQDLIEFMKS